MNDPKPLDVIQNCLDAIDCIDDVDEEIDKNDIKCVVEYKHYEFVLNNQIKFIVRYNDDVQRTEVEIIAPEEKWRKRVQKLKQYPQYANKTDEECWPQKYLLTKMLDDVSYISNAYEDIHSNI